MQVVTSADVFGIYMEGVQQHLDDAFAHKGHPDASPQFPQATAGPFSNSALAPPQPGAQQVAAEQPRSQPQPQPQPAASSTDDIAALSGAAPKLQDPAAPAVAAAPAANHTAAELPEGPAHDAAAATAANGIPTAIVPTDNNVVIEAVSVPAALDKDNKSETPTGDTCNLILGPALWFPIHAECNLHQLTGQQRLHCQNSLHNQAA